MGKGLTGSRSLYRKPCPGMQGRQSKANLTAGNSRKKSRFAEARLSEEPGAIIPHAGICAGGGWVTALPTATATNNLRFTYETTKRNHVNSHQSRRRNWMGWFSPGPRYCQIQRNDSCICGITHSCRAYSG